MNGSGQTAQPDARLATEPAAALLSEHVSISAALDSQFSQNYYAVMGSGGFQYRW